MATKKVKPPFDIHDVWVTRYGGGTYNYTIIKAPIPVAWKNVATGESPVLDNIYFGGREGSNDRPLIITRIENIRTKEVVDLYKKIWHVNVKQSSETLAIIASDGIEYRITGQRFCNDVKECHIYSNPRHSAMELAHNLCNQNPSSAYNSGHSASNTAQDLVITCKRCGDILKNDLPPFLLVNRICAGCYSVSPELITKTGTGVKTYYKAESDQNYKTLLPAVGGLSSYYKSLTGKSVRDGVKELPRAEKDIIILGMGSAGSGVVEQLCRTKLLKSYVLVDFDEVEKKNLRNQFYDHSVVGYSKVEGAKDIIKRINRDISISYHNKKFQQAPLDRFKSKFVMLGFDTIDTRLEALKSIEKGIILTDYIIDTRYDGLDSSIYFIDVSDKQQMKYYKDNLKADKSMLDKIKKEHAKTKVMLPPITPEYAEYFISQIMQGGCSRASRILCGGDGIINLNQSVGTCHGCGSEACRRHVVDTLNANGVKVLPQDKAQFSEMLKLGEELPADTTTSTCIAWNIIDIYKYASSYVVSSIRELMEGRPKAFTHVEATTNVLPNAMVIRK